MMLEYPLYRRRNAIRRYDMLVETDFKPISDFTLPIGSVYHYLGESVDSVAPNTSYTPIAQYTNLKYVDYVLDLKTTKGSPRKLNLTMDPLMKQHQRSNRTIRPVRNVSTALRDRRSLLIVSYALINRTYRYRMDVWAGYNRWYNLWDTVTKNINDLMSTTGVRQHFIQIPLPSRLNTLSLYRRASSEFKQSYLPEFQDPRNLTILDLFHWLGEGRVGSILANIEPQHLSKVNLCWVVNGRFTSINLGELDGWRVTTDKEKAELLKRFNNNPDTSSYLEGKENLHPPRQLQRTFMAFLLNAMTLKLGAVETEVIDDAELESEVIETEDDVVAENVVGDESELEDDVDYESELVDEADDKPTPEVMAEIEDKVNKKINDFDAAAKLLNEKLQAAERDAFEYKPKDITPEGTVADTAGKLAEAGLVPAENYRRVLRASEAYKRIENPFGEGTLEDFITSGPEDLSIDEDRALTTDKDGVTDKSLLNNTKDAMFKAYMRDYHDRYLAKTALSVQQAGIALRNYKVREHRDLFNHYETHTLTLVTAAGEPSTVSFKIPKVQPDGTYLYNGNRMRMRSQRGDLPIRKISHREVALSSYYSSKIMISRSERAAFNYGRWLVNTIVKQSMENPESVSGLRYANVFDRTQDLPNVYAILSKEFSGFEAGDYKFNFEPLGSKRKTLDIDPKQIDKAKTIIGKAAVCGEVNGKPLLMTHEGNQIYVLDPATNNVTNVGTIEELCDIPEGVIAKRPYEIVEFGIAGKQIPIGFVLGYHLGLSGMIKFLDLDVQRLPRYGEGRYRPGGDDIAITFEDEVVVINRNDRIAMFTLGSMMRFRNDIRRHPVALFDKPDGWQAVLTSNKIGVRYTRELDNVRDMFIDPITEDVLKQMGEPTDMLLLYKRALEMLLNDKHHNPTYFFEERDKGYERFVGFAYTELTKAIRQYRNRGGLTSGQVSLNPEAVWMQCIKDPASIVVQESNPVHNVKERDVVVYSGTGGRSARTMTAKYRTYDESDVGITGEGTVDSGNVGTIMFLTADPKYGNVLGMADPNKSNDDLEPANLQTYPMAISAGADRDDPKRNMMVGIQWSQTIAAQGYTPGAIRTGAERTMAYRNDDKFATTAPKAGKVIEVDEDMLVVEYEDGDRQVFDMGRSYGTFAGVTLPHSMTTTLKAGDSFKEGDFLSFNGDYYTPDPLSPGQLLFKPGLLARTAFLEGPDTYEDSSAITPDLAERLKTNITTPVIIRVRFDQHLRNLVKPGDEVDIESILCTVENSSVEEAYNYGEDAGDILKRLDAINPRASRVGVVERIDVYYNGFLEDMTESLLAVVRASDRRLAKRARALGHRVSTGEVEPGFSLEGKTLGNNEAAIVVYITGPVAMGVGDKGVFGNQLKTIVGRVLTGEEKGALDGQPIDAYFGYYSTLARIVESISVLGTTSTLSVELSRRVVEAYRGK